MVENTEQEIQVSRSLEVRELFEDRSLDLEVFVEMQQGLEMLAVLEAVMDSGCLVLKHASVSGEEALEEVVLVVVCVDDEAVMRV